MSVQRVSYETEACSRCSGTGNHSYCQRYGTVCFKCGGKGTQLSKRGKAAKKRAEAWKAENVDFTVAALQVGDTILGTVIMGGEIGNRWERVIEITRNDYVSKGSSDGGKTWVEYQMTTITTNRAKQHAAEHLKIQRKLRQDEMNGLGAHMKGRVGCIVEEAN